MSEQHPENDSAEVTDARQEAAERVVERVNQRDDGAPPETVREHLEEGLEEAGVPVEESELDRVSEKIHDEGSSEAPDVE